MGHQPATLPSARELRPPAPLTRLWLAGDGPADPDLVVETLDRVDPATMPLPEWVALAQMADAVPSDHPVAGRLRGFRRRNRIAALTAAHLAEDASAALNGLGIPHMVLGDLPLALVHYATIGVRPVHRVAVWADPAASPGSPDEFARGIGAQVTRADRRRVELSRHGIDLVILRGWPYRVFPRPPGAIPETRVLRDGGIAVPVLCRAAEATRVLNQGVPARADALTPLDLRALGINDPQVAADVVAEIARTQSQTLAMDAWHRAASAGVALPEPDLPRGSTRHRVTQRLLLGPRPIRGVVGRLV